MRYLHHAFFHHWKLLEIAWRISKENDQHPSLSRKSLCMNNTVDRFSSLELSLLVDYKYLLPVEILATIEMEINNSKQEPNLQAGYTHHSNRTTQNSTSDSTT